MEETIFIASFMLAAHNSDMELMLNLAGDLNELDSESQERMRSSIPSMMKVDAMGGLGDTAYIAACDALYGPDPSLTKQFHLTELDYNRAILASDTTRLKELADVDYSTLAPRYRLKQVERKLAYYLWARGYDKIAEALDEWKAAGGK